MSFNPDSQENQLLFARAKSGSAAFAQELLKQQTNDMYYLARAYLKDTEEAKMAVRMGFAKALKRLNTVNDIHDFRDWLANIVRLTAVDSIVPLETETAQERYTRLDERPAENVSFPSKETCQRQLLQVLNLLNDSERAAAAARYYDHMEVEDAASLLRLSAEDTETLLVNAKKKLTDNKVDISEFTALTEFINPSARLEKAVPEEETLILDDEPKKEETPADAFSNGTPPAAKQETPAAEEEKSGPVDETFESAKPLKRQEKRRKAKPQPVEEEDEDEDDIDYDDDEGYDDYDYDKKGRRKRHKSHIVLKIILILIIILAVIGALLFGIYKVDQDLFYSIPGTTRLVTALENITGKDIQQPYENTTPVATAAPESTAAATPEATVSAAPTEGLIAGTETGTDTAVGNVQIQLEAVNVRSNHDASSEQVGTVYQGETYDVYGVFKSADYTWYRIGEGMWVADDGSYLTYTALN